MLRCCGRFGTEFGPVCDISAALLDYANWPRFGKPVVKQRSLSLCSRTGFWSIHESRVRHSCNILPRPAACGGF